MPIGPPSRIAIVGTGLIGASIGLALRQRAPSAHVVGTDPNPTHADAARQRGALSSVADLEGAVDGADLVVLATPLDATPRLLDRLDQIGTTALVTDVGSVKAPVVRHAAARRLRFVGGHPMAGAAVSGPAHAEPLLFENAVWVLTPPDDSPPIREAAPEVLWLVQTLRARAVVMSARRHDEVAAVVSHLPQLVAVSLVEALADAGDDALALAAGGFRDMTRIAGSPFSMWGPILHDNRDVLARTLREFGRRVSAMGETVATEPEGLRESFERAGRIRGALPTTSKGFLAPLADVVVWADDRPGFLHGLTGAIADAGLNVRDAELLRVREGEQGTFRFGFASPAEADSARAALTAAGYRATRR